MHVDILVSLIALLFLLPLLASCIFILRYTEKRNIFLQKIGINRKSFMS